MSLSASSIIPPEPGSEAAAKRDARSTRSVLMIWMDDNGDAMLCASPIQGFGTVEPRQANLNLSGPLSRKRVRNLLRDLQWRNQRGSPCYVVMPSEHVLLQVEEFPTTDVDEAAVMAEGLVQGLVELDPAEHVMLMRDLHRGPNHIVCALAIFERKRLQQIFEWVHKLGVSEPRFVLDVLAMWQVSGHTAADEYWGRVVKEPGTDRVLVKGLKIEHGVLRAACQRYYHRPEVNEEWVATLGAEIFPDNFREGDSPGITWYVSTRGPDSPSHLVNLCRMSATEGLIHFEPPRGFWSDYLRIQRRKRAVKGLIQFAIGAYLLLILGLVGAGIFQWSQIRKLERLQNDQEPAYKEALLVKHELDAIKASQNPSGNALEMLRQLGESMPDTITLENFNYHFQDYLKLRGTANQSEAVYDFVTRMRDNPAFRSIQQDGAMGDRPGGGVNWQVIVPLKSVSSTGTAP